MADVRVGHDQQTVAQVVEDEQRVGEHEYGVGQPKVVVRRRRQPLHVTNHVVREVADGTALEAGQARHGHRGKLAQQPAQRLERIAIGQALGPVPAPQRDPAVFGAEDHEWIAAEE